MLRIQFVSWAITWANVDTRKETKPDLPQFFYNHYTDVIMGAIASLITNITIVYSSVYSGADQRKHQSSASLAFVRGIHRGRWIPRTDGQ